MLRRIKVPGVRGPNTELDILLHCVDPTEVHGSHGSSEDSFTTIRRPDLAIISLMVARLLAGRSLDWKTITSNAPDPPSPDLLKWFHILSAVELKFKKKLTMPLKADLSPDKMQPTIPPQEKSSFTPPDAPAEPAVAELPVKLGNKPCV